MKCSVVGLLIVSISTIAAAADPQVISYNRDIRPILSDKCFQCHGPDENSRKADLRLDLRESATDARSDSAAITPDQPDASLVLQRIATHDVSEVMPPPETKKTITDSEAKLLRLWIEQGANYEGHWAFLPVSPTNLPVVTKNRWVKNEIDRFILAKLEAQSIKPSPQADPATLVRRLYVDLLGLLPPPEVVDRFIANPSDEAYAKLVDNLLANPHYGERWGRYWLDQARYADSNGYTIDGDRVMWPYRDWVIQAINRDMPFDQFTIEQLAGDLLARPTKSQLVATGFHRNTLINQEGGTDNEQFRNEEVVDRVNTTGAVWLGLTVGCAQCHSHKFDPISQKEFYQLFAFFNHTEDVNNTGPTIEVHENEMFIDEISSEHQKKLDAAQAGVASLIKSRAKRQEQWSKSLLASLRESNKAVEWTHLRPEKLEAISAELQTLEDGSILASRGEEKEKYTVTFQRESSSKIAAVRLRVIPHESLPKNGPGLAGNGNFVLTDVRIAAGGRVVAVSRAQASHHQPNFPIENAIDGKPNTGWAINVGPGSNKKMNAPHVAHFVLAEPIRTNAPITITLDHQANGSFYNVGRFAIDVAETAPQAIIDATLLKALETPADKRNGEMKKLLAGEFAKQDTELRRAEQRIVDVKREIGLGTSVRCMVMRDRGEPRETFVQIRGDFLRPDKEKGPLFADVPAIFPPLAEKPDRITRLQLAKWLVRPDHPLTSRVTVNRVWLRYFGTGLVETENDFGTQGAYPTHPELLDWLANRFITDAWSLKSLHKLIVTSATYRQSSHARPDLAKVDSLNQLLARQIRLRFDAETVRDAALSASGLLEQRLGGPSVRPPQPEGVYAFTQTRKDWTVDSGPDRYRRALYTRFYRSAPYPLFTTFDSPDFQSVCTARVRSNTPLQSLTMANDAAQFELAKGLASRVLKEITQDDFERINRLFLICLSRLPSDSERSAVTSYLSGQYHLFGAAPEDAQQVAAKDLPAGVSAATGAAWTSLARAIMNTDEFITRE